MTVRTYTAHEISAELNSLPSQIFVREEDYNQLADYANQMRDQIMSMRAYMQFGTFQGLSYERLEKFRIDFDQILENK